MSRTIRDCIIADLLALDRVLAERTKVSGDQLRLLDELEGLPEGSDAWDARWSEIEELDEDVTPRADAVYRLLVDLHRLSGLLEPGRRWGIPTWLVDGSFGGWGLGRLGSIDEALDRQLAARLLKARDPDLASRLPLELIDNCGPVDPETAALVRANLSAPVPVTGALAAATAGASAAGRVEVPVVIRDLDRGLVLSCSLRRREGPAGLAVSCPEFTEFPTGHEPIVTEPTWFDTKDFGAGAEAGHAAAISLLADLGVPSGVIDGVAHLQLDVNNIAPPTVVEQRSAGLPVALHVIARALFLPAPPMPATGPIDADGTLIPINDADVLQQKLDGVLDEGISHQLLACTELGDLPDGVIRCGPTLRDTAAAVWPDRWPEITRRFAIESASRHFRVGWPDSIEERALVVDGRPIVVPTRQEVVLRQTFVVGREPAAAIGGGPNSGKTSIASAVARALTELGWHVQVLTPNEPERQVPDRELLIEAADRLLPLGPARQQSLLVLEDLRPGTDTEDDDLAEYLSEVTDRLGGAHVLAVIATDERRADWKTNGITVVTPHATVEQRTQFAESVVEHLGLTATSAAIGTIVRLAGRDMWWLVRMLADGAGSAPSQPTSFTTYAQEYLTTRVAAWSDRKRRQAERLAACAWIGVGIPDASLRDAGDPGSITDAELAMIGAERSVQGEWRLTSRFTARILLADRTGGDRLDGNALISCLDAELDVALAGDAARAGGILRAAGRLDETVLARLVERRDLDTALPAWANQGGRTSDELLTVIEPAEYALRSDTIAELVRRLARTTITAVPAVEPGSLTRVLRTLIRHRDAVEAAPLDGGPPLMERLLEVLGGGGLGEILQRSRSAEVRLRVLEQLIRLDTDASLALVNAHAEAALVDLEIGRARDYRHVARLEDLLYRSTRGQDGSGNRSELRRRLERLGVVEALLDQRPGRGAKASVVLSWWGLNLAFGRLGDAEWDDEDLRGAVIHNLNGTSAIELSTALHFVVESNRGFASKLLNSPLMSDAFRGRLAHCTPGEAAILIGTIANINAAVAFRMICDEAGPDRKLVEIFARRLQQTGDDKSAGLLFGAVLAIDETFGSVADGFGKALAEALTVEFARTSLANDPRTSVLHHLIRGLARAQASYMPELRELTRVRIGEVLRGSRQPWAPRLALELASDRLFGEDFLDELQPYVDEQRMFRLMGDARGAEALAVMHDLGRALYPRLATRFVREFDDGKIGALRSGRPEVLAMAALSWQRTFRVGGSPTPGADLLQRMLPRCGVDVHEWSRRVLTCRNPSAAAEVLTSLQRLDPPTAAAVVRDLTGAPDGNAAASDPEDPSETAPPDNRIGWRLRRWADDPVQVSRLLFVLEKADPGAGEATLAYLRNSGGWWRAFVHNIHYLQGPHDLGQAVWNLSRAGHRFGIRDRTQLEKAWSEERVSHIRGPDAIRHLLRAFAILPPDGLGDGVEVQIDQVDWQRLVGRIAEGASIDLEGGIRLAGVLLALGDRPHATQVIDGIVGIGGLDSRLPVGPLARLARLAFQVGHRNVPIENALASRIGLEAGRSRVLDDRRHWDVLGWTAHELWKLGWREDLRLPATHPTLDRASPAHTLWALAWNGDPSSAEYSERAWAQLARVDHPLSPDGACMVLAASATRPEHSSEVLHRLRDVGQDWNRVARSASVSRLRAAITTSMQHEPSSIIVTGMREVIVERLSSAAFAADYDASEALEAMP